MPNDYSQTKDHKSKTTVKGGFPKALPKFKKAEKKMASAPRSPSPELNPLSLAENTDLTPLPTYKNAETTSITFDSLLPPNQPLLLHEDLTSGCGGQLWPAGMVLSKYMLRYHKEDLKDELMFVCPAISFPPMPLLYLEIFADLYFLLVM